MQSSWPRARRYAVGVALLCFLAVGAGLWLRQRPETKKVSPQPPLTSTVTQTGRDAREGLSVLVVKLRGNPSPAEAGELLAEWRAALAKAGPAAAARWIQEFLAGGADARLPSGFTVGANGWLASAPTLRVWLLDELSRLEAAAGAAAARRILNRMDSPEEWAVALRNLARGESTAESRAYLERKMEELLRYEPWQQNPSVGYLEAFDVAVFLGGTNLVPALADLARKKDNQAVAHAAFLSLDRLTIADPAATLALLEASPELMRGREETRANLFARADVRDARQREVVESYLLNPQLGAAELECFAGLYPNANFMISHNLLTRPLTPDHATLAARDREALRVVESWLAQPRFARIKPQLQRVERRLREFVR